MSYNPDIEHPQLVVDLAAVPAACCTMKQPQEGSMQSDAHRKDVDRAEADRLATLLDYQVLDTAAEASFDRLTRAAADVCGTPMALISLVDANRQWFKSNIGVPLNETPRDISFCAHAILHEEILVVQDASADPRFSANPMVASNPGLRFYAGAPLSSPDGYRIGTLCVLDGGARSDGLSTTQACMLRTLAAQVIAELELRRTMAKLHWLVHHDTLTKLPNRMYFYERLDRILAMHADSSPVRAGVALLDLDHFKQINDVYGHDAGDALLQHVATLLTAFVLPVEMAARLGGDEFVIVLDDCGTDAAIASRIDILLAQLRVPFSFRGHNLDCSASVGLAFSSGQGRDAGTLLKHADIAMYRAKAAGRGQLWMYHPDLGARIARQVSSVQTVRTAIRTGNIYPHYQPQFDLKTGAIVGCEALVRICDSSGIVHLPADIGDAFEDRDVGVGIGRCMLARAITDMHSWLEQGFDVHHVAINASAVELRCVDYAEVVLNALAAGGLAPSRLNIEVTEGVLVGSGSEQIYETLRALSAAGISIALDDFGTGFASLSHLKDFPVETIKIDQSFVASLSDSTTDLIIVTAIIQLATDLGMDLIAEGVETGRQANILRQIGCITVQGFFFSRALSADAFSDLLKCGRNRQSVRIEPARSSGAVRRSRRPSEPCARSGMLPSPQLALLT